MSARDQMEIRSGAALLSEKAWATFQARAARVGIELWRAVDGARRTRVFAQRRPGAPFAVDTIDQLEALWVAVVAAERGDQAR